MSETDTRQELLAELTELVHGRHFDALHNRLRPFEPPDLAEVLESLPYEVEAIVFRLLDKERALDTFEYLGLASQERLIRNLGDREVAGILNEMSADDRTALLEELPGEVTRRLMNLLTPEERDVATRLLNYPEDSIGRLMTPDYVAVKRHWTVAEALEHVRVYGSDSETLNVVYVTGPGGVLIDDLRMREMLLVDPGTRIADMIDETFVALHASDDQETAVAVFRKHDRSALPVVDSKGVIVGIVTVDDVFDVAEEEATEDIQMLGGVEALDEPYLSISLGKVIRKRAFWLVLLFLGQTLTATAMGFFEAEIASAVVLALFLPLIISSGGNSGSQAAALVTRAMALGEVGVRDWWQIMRRELGAGLVLGLMLGALGFIRVAIWGLVFDAYGGNWLLIGLTIFMSLVGVVLWGSLTGSLLPIALKRLGADPAASSTPFVATIVDVTGIVIFFALAKLVLTGTLL
ncbi:MAG: magnesium transporter [Trueperaceae bacterium]|nr:magnesium transporter [Truepera sp.]HRN19498.1 magnesium transporter [Trueperaceae bacterium]